MLERSSDKATADDARASLPTVAPDEPYTVDLGKLELVQRWSQYAAVVVLVVFVVLFVAGSIMLNNLYARISRGQETLDKQAEQIKANDLKIKSQEGDINIRNTALRALLNPDTKPLDTKQASQVQQLVETNIEQSVGEQKIARELRQRLGDPRADGLRSLLLPDVACDKDRRRQHIACKPDGERDRSGREPVEVQERRQQHHGGEDGGRQNDDAHALPDAG